MSLPPHVSPTHYSLTLEPLFETLTFLGETIITFTVHQPTSSITLNSWDIEISRALIDDHPVESISYDTAQQTVTFTFEEAVDTECVLNLTFKGVLNDEMNGFYKSSYRENGKTKYLAASHLEPTACRRAFPCYDEPAAKAKFTITLIADQELTCLSNMDIKETTLLDNDKKRVLFNTSPPMSTYLVGFIVGDLRYVENTSFRVPIRVYAVPEYVGQCCYAADIAAKCLSFFEEQFDIPYPLPKCDLVAVPDFLIGGMENFGMITFRQDVLLLDTSKTDLRSQILVTEVVAHELAHQWFGNLVTMQFWDGLWLKEGFATWMSWYACNSLFPEWKVWESYVGDDLQRALSLDALRSSHPIDVPVESAAQIGQIFDAISYSKGSAVLAMVSSWLGEGVFIKGVSNYLKRHKWGNTRNDDLWASLGEVSGKDVTAVMDTWTRKIGYPVVSVDEKEAKLVLTQQRYLSTGDLSDDEDVIYPIFLRIKTDEGVDESILDSKTVTIDSYDFFKLNSDQFGVFRTAYSSERWKKLGEAGVAGKLSVSDRIGLVSDVAALSSSGHVPTADLFSLIGLWSSEDNYVVWDEMLKRLAELHQVLVFEDETVRNNLNRFIRRLISPKISEVGYNPQPSDSLPLQQLKLELLAAGVSCGHEQAVAFARGQFTAYMYGRTINPELYSVVFKAAVLSGDSTVFKQMLEVYKNPKTIQQKSFVLGALGLFENADIAQEVLSMLLDPEVVRQQDILTGLRGFGSHPLGIRARWEWFTKNWAAIVKSAPPNSTMLGNLVSVCSGAFTKEEQRREVEGFFGDKDTSGYRSALEQVYERIEGRVRRIGGELEEIKRILAY